MSCCGGNAGTAGTRGGIARWIGPVFIVAVLAIVPWSALSSRGRLLKSTEAPATPSLNQSSQP